MNYMYAAMYFFAFSAAESFYFLIMKTSNNAKRRKKRWEMLQRMRKVTRTRVFRA